MTEIDKEENDLSVDGISCVLAFTLFNTNDLHFECNWSTEEDVLKMAALINAILKTDLIKDNLKQMETSDEEGKRLLLTLFKSKQYITPLEVGGLNAS